MPDMSVLPPVSAESDALIDQAQQLARRWGLAFNAHVDAGLVLMQTAERVELRQLDEPKLGAVYVDFNSDALAFRRLHGGGRKESIAKAVGVKGQALPRVLDATAGLGRDAFVLASLGCQVDMIERSPVVAALLADGLKRAEHAAELSAWLPQKMQLFHGVSYDVLSDWQGEQPDVVYLDPMFPHRKKSAAVKKEMRIFQHLLGPDEDADKLLMPALALAAKRVVVKRPDAAPFLAETKPSMEIKTKKHRFDVYITNT
ncbi:class I SAM-dependent methyltransferase [Aestuariibacter sp. AA17]|uniref:Ribosomal RNA small subunit methyltransferase J n=2 Tax=Fluctibacter corallii TaxID=2984329 RepID=A0ABT3AC38_9ALTE|nr:class I SAM-dependent methyltransferase [Aestuariibacter sp. AA17]